MNKRINFEDTAFILNVRIRMIRDLLHLDTDTSLFLRQTIDDLDFINSALEALTEKFLANLEFLDKETEADNISDVEWQFTQLLNEITNTRSPFSPARFPETQAWVVKFRKENEKRQKLIDTSYVPMDKAAAEPLVSNAELNGLLGSA